MGDMGHRHLVLAYAATIVVHLVYLTYVVLKMRSAKKTGQ